MFDRRTLLAAGAALALPLPIPARAQVDTTGLGTLAPFTLQDLAGQAQAVPAAGKPAIVNLWATWCPPCRAEMPLLATLGELYGDRLALQLVNHKERLATVQRFLQSSGTPLPVLLDPQGEVATRWGVRVFPTTYGFDAQGRVRWRVRGEYDWSSAAAGRLADALLAR
jgi:thiol-disulfide isomerase/thioredoxin